MLHVAFVRSTEAHATITSIDTAEAAAHPGVVGVFTAEDLGFEGGIPMVWAPPGVEINTPDHMPLKSGEVKCVGDPVAVVVGRDKYGVVDAAEKVIVEYDPKPAVVDPEAALEDGSPLVWDQFGTNKTHEWAVAGGDIDAALAEADVVIEHRIVNHRIAGAPIEPRGAIAEPRGDDAHAALVDARSRTSPASSSPASLGHARGRAARGRARRRRRLRLQAQHLRRGGDPRARSRASSGGR